MMNSSYAGEKKMRQLLKILLSNKHRRHPFKPRTTTTEAKQQQGDEEEAQQSLEDQQIAKWKLHRLQSLVNNQRQQFAN